MQKLRNICSTDSCNAKVVIVIFGGFLVHLALGAGYTFGNFAPYFISYLRNRTDDTEIRNVDGLWISAMGSVGNCFGLSAGGLFAHKFGSRIATLIGAVVFCGSVAINYFSVQRSFLALIFTYGLIGYLGHKLTYGTPIQTAISWLPKHATLASGLIVSGTGGGSLIFNQIITAYINPENLSPNLIIGKGERYFTQPELLDRVPTCFLILGGIYFGIMLIGIACLAEPPRQDIQLSLDKTNPEHEGTTVNCRCDGREQNCIIMTDINSLDKPMTEKNSSDFSEALTQPVTGVTQPVTGITQPATGITQPVTGITQPVTGITQPVTGITQPVTGITQPVTGITQPVTGITQPVTVRDIQHDKDSLKDRKAGNSNKSENNSSDSAKAFTPVTVCEIQHGEESLVDKKVKGSNKALVNGCINEGYVQNEETFSETGTRIDRKVDMDDAENTKPKSKPELGIKEAVKVALRSRCFYIIWLTVLLITAGMIFVIGLYKAYGQTFIHDDHFLAMVGSIAAIFNCSGRPIWGAVMDRFGYRVAIRGVSVGFSGLAATLLLTERLPKGLFMAWICGFYFSFSGVWSMMPSALAKLLGPQNMAINYGIIYTGVSIGSIAATVAGTSLKSLIGWHGLFYMAAGMGTIVFISSFFFNGVDRQGKRI